MQLKRREILKGSLLGAGMTVGLTDVFAKGSSHSGESEFPTETFDVVVVGAGMAGMCGSRRKGR